DPRHGRVRARARRLGPRVRLRDPPAARRPLARGLRPGALPAPDPREWLLLVRRLGAARRPRRVRASPRPGRPRQPRGSYLGGSAPQPAAWLLSRRGGRPRPAGTRSGDDRPRAAPDVGVVRGLDLVGRPRRTARCQAVGRGGPGMTRAEWGRL